MQSTDVTVVGAGPVGSLLAIHLARRGHQVTLLERRPDMRKASIAAGRSINLAVSTRGLRALRDVGLEEEVLRQAIPMRGRMIHALDGTLAYQPYGQDDSEFINSMSRGELNKTLMTAAEGTGRVSIEFGKRIVDRDFATGRLRVYDEAEATTTDRAAPVVIAADGSASAIRTAMMARPGYTCAQTPLDYGYKELTMPATAGGGFALEKHALHIWPRGTYMLIALPNFDGSFTCTLFLPHEGTPSFKSLATPHDVQAFFAERFADALPLIPDLAQTFFANPAGHMVTVKCAPWHVGGNTLLLGDAAHAIVPFFGQGMNCGFEDCTVLAQGLDTVGQAWEPLFSRFSALRRSDADAIADMAVENFVEMRDKVGDPAFLMRKEVEKRLQRAFPGEFFSRYAMVTFSHMPYRAAFDAGHIADGIVGELCAGIQHADNVDLSQAGTLIRTRLAPFLQQHREGSNPWT